MIPQEGKEAKDRELTEDSAVILHGGMASWSSLTIGELTQLGSGIWTFTLKRANGARCLVTVQPMPDEMEETQE
jgi:hypothetical protein